MQCNNIGLVQGGLTRANGKSRLSIREVGQGAQELPVVIRHVVRFAAQLKIVNL